MSLKFLITHLCFLSYSNLAHITVSTEAIDSWESTRFFAKQETFSGPGTSRSWEPMAPGIPAGLSVGKCALFTIYPDTNRSMNQAD